MITELTIQVHEGIVKLPLLSQRLRPLRNFLLSCLDPCVIRSVGPAGELLRPHETLSTRRGTGLESKNVTAAFSLAGENGVRGNGLEGKRGGETGDIGDLSELFVVNLGDVEDQLLVGDVGSST